MSAQIDMTQKLSRRTDAEGLMMGLLLPGRMLGGYGRDPDGINVA